MSDTNDQSGLRRGVFQVVLAYAVFASLWILLSDRAIGVVFVEHEQIVQASMIKGWLFVAVTTLLLYLLVRRFIGQLHTVHRRELEALLLQQRSLQLIDTLVESSDDAIFAKDAEGRYLLFNRAAASFVGKPVEAVLGRDDRDLFPADQAEMLIQIGRRVMATGQIETNEEVVDTANGRRTFLATKGPLHDADGGIYGIFGISHDITERKQAETELQHRNEELERFNHAAIERELRMIALKQEVNALACELGRSPPYALKFLKDDTLP